MTDVIVVTIIVLFVGLGGLYVAIQPVRSSKQELREIEILERIKRAEEWIQRYATMSFVFDVPTSSASFSMSTHNRKTLESSRISGCYHCLQVFVPELINEWKDGGLTACCPFCGNSAVVTDPDGVSLNVVNLLMMHRERRDRGPIEPNGNSEPLAG